jgi:hypothetical protein
LGPKQFRSSREIGTNNTRFGSESGREHRKRMSANGRKAPWKIVQDYVAKSGHSVVHSIISSARERSDGGTKNGIEHHKHASHHHAEAG